MKTIKKTAWALLERLPIALANLILEASGRKDAPALAVLNEKYSLAVRLAVWKILSTTTCGEWNGVLLIGGPPRIGKTTVSRRAAARLGAATVISLDDHRQIWERAPASLRVAVKRAFVDSLCRQGRGLVIEGVDLVTHDRVSKPPAGGVRFSASVILSFSCHANVTCILLGAAGQTPDAKLDGMIRSARVTHCWAVKQFDEPGLLRLARKIVESSDALRQDALRTCIHYFDMPALCFIEKTAAIADQIALLAGQRRSASIELEQVVTRRFSV